ncbi:MAG: hypothetical protein AB1442_16780 [Nitrospirota bacterium]
MKNKDVKERFRQQFNMPKLTVEKALLAPPLSNRYGLVGTAFDYLMRFYLKWLNQDAVTREWIAEHSITNLFSPLLKDVGINGETGEIISYTETELTRKAHWIIEQAKVDYSTYLSSGQISQQLLESALRLAQLDPIFRVGFVDENLGTIYKEDIDDLQQLITIVEPELFKAIHLCLLNPTFGEASRLVGGADADLLIDDTIIDIKTTKSLQLKRDYFNQLIGYFVLHEIAGIGGIEPKPKISTLGIYFSRHAYLYTIELQDIIDSETFPGFVNWFIERAKQEYAV